MIFKYKFNLYSYMMLKYIFLAEQWTKPHVRRTKSYAPRGPWMKQCWLWRKMEEEEEKSNCFTHPAQSSTNTHPHLNHREGMATYERKKSPTLDVRNKKTQERVKLSKIK